MLELLLEVLLPGERVDGAGSRCSGRAPRRMPGRCSAYS